ARKLWRARTFLDEALKADTADARARALRLYHSQKDEVSVDELLTILRTLPPPDADTDLRGEVLQRNAKAGRRKGIEYFVQMPSEYTTARSYPVVIVLAHSKETPKEALARASA